METNKIIEYLDKYQVRLFINQNGSVVPAAPTVLAENLLLIRGLLIQLVDKVAEAERSYRLGKAQKYDALIKDGATKSAARDTTDLDAGLAERKIESERLRNYMKYTDGLCTSIQSVLRVQSASDKSTY